MKKKYTRDFKSDEGLRIENENLVFSFASSMPYLRESKKLGEYYEVLEISENAIDFQRLVDNRAPLLLNHDTDQQIGTVVRAWIADEKLYAEVKFSDSELAQQIYRDVTSGIRRNTSIGYSINEFTMKQGNPPTMLATKWMPYEVTLCPVPADETVGYQRSEETEDDGDMEEETKSSEETKPAETEAVKACEETEEEQKCDDAEAKKSAEIEEIRSLGELAECKELAEKFISEEKSYSDFKLAVKELKTEKLNVKEDNNMSENTQKFSIRKAILNAVGKMSDEEASFERSISDENKRKYNIQDGDIVLSRNEFRAFDGTGDAALINTTYQSSLYTENLRPPATVDYLGTKKVGVPNGPISFSVCTSGLNAGFCDLNGEVPSASMAFELKTMNPHKQRMFLAGELFFTASGQPRGRRHHHGRYCQGS